MKRDGLDGKPHLVGGVNGCSVEQNDLGETIDPGSATADPQR